MARLDKAGVVGGVALRKELEGAVVDESPREDQKHNCRRDKQR